MTLAHWLDGVARVLMTPDSDMRNLASVAGCSPKDLYEYCDLTECDLRGQDLRGLSFEGANLEGAVLDNKTLVDAEFDPRLKAPEYFSFRANKKLLQLLNSQAYTTKSTYAVWFVKWLFDLMYISRQSKIVRDISDSILDLQLDNFYSSGTRHDSVRRRVKIPSHLRKFAREFPEEVDEKDRPSFILLVALIMRNRRGDSEINALQIIDRMVDEDERIRSSMGYFSNF